MRQASYLLYILACILLSFFYLENAAAQHNITQYNLNVPYGFEVNTHNGNLFYQQSDLSLPAIGMDINFVLSYNSSRHLDNFGFGRGWIANYGMMYKTDPSSGNITLERSDGQRHTFADASGSYTSPTGNFESFSEYTPNQYELAQRDGTKYFFDDPSHQKLTRIEDRYGNTCTFSYNGSGELTQITSSCGTSISLTWSGGFLQQVTDATETPTRAYQYQYTGDLLTQYTDPAGFSESYGYDALGRMMQFTNKRGFTLDFTYNPYGAVASVTSALNSYTLDYNIATLQTTVTEPVGSMTQTTTYQYNALKQLTQKIGNCCGYNVQYLYDTSNNISQIIDANGHITTYSYNGNGQVIQEQDALGNSIFYSYGTAFNLVTSMTDKNGTLYGYTYDGNGNLLQVNNSIYSESYTYNPDGTRATHTDGNGNVRMYSYDACGQLQSLTEPLGKVTQYDYNNRGELQSDTDANSCVTTYTYDQLGRMLTMTDPSDASTVSGTTTYTYDAVGNRMSVTDANGNPPTAYVYDALDRLTDINQPMGISTRYAYDEKNRISMTDPEGNTTNYVYNSQNLLESQTDAESITLQYAYDAKGNRTMFTDGKNYVYTYEYDDIDQLKKVTNPLTDFRTMNYDPNGNLIDMTDEENNTTTYAYDAINRRIGILDAEAYTTSFSYDNNNNQTALVDANGNPTTYNYDALDRLVTVTDALSFMQQFTYDLEGNQLSATDANGNTITNEYDCLNRLILSYNDLSETTMIAYDANGNQTQITQPNGNVVNYSYDDINRLEQVSDNIGLVVQYGYDLNSNVTSQTDGNSNTVMMAYDGINRLDMQTDAMGETSSLLYDDNSNVIARSDRENNTTAYSYDMLNRQTEMMDAMTYSTQSEYDKVGNLTKLTDENGNETSYTYDDIYRNTVATYADLTTKTYTYDGVGNMITRTDNNSDLTTYGYDAIYRLTGRDYPGTNDDSFGYDAGGRMISANNSNATITYSYDQANRIMSETLNGQSTGYAYDIPNRKRTLTYPSSRTIEENYDHRHRLDIINEAASMLADFDYDTGNRMTQKSYANGTNTAYSYNANNWINQLSHNNGSNFVDFEYTHDKEGNKQYARHNHKPDFSEEYSYDAIYRLTNYKKGTLAGANIPTPTTESDYAFDGLGNWQTVNTDGAISNYTANNMNEYTLITNPAAINPTNDDNGNLSFDGNTNYSYDYENRLLTAGSNNSYQYDALGRRIQKNVAGTISQYFFDGARVIEEQDATNSPQATYLYGTWIDDILQMQGAGNAYYYHHNALGSVVALTDATGTVTERYEYNAYGKPTFYDATYSSTMTGSAVANPYLFTARRWDAESDLYYYRARHYHPELGRFMQRDPLGYVDGMNLMEYVGGNGVNWGDPFGGQATKTGKPTSPKPRRTKFKSDESFSTKKVDTKPINIKKGQEIALPKNRYSYKDKSPIIYVYQIICKNGKKIITYRSEMTIDSDGATDPKDRTSNTQDKNNMTSLNDNKGKAIDASNVPYIAIPYVIYKAGDNNLNLGDFALVYNENNERYNIAIIADNGNSNHIGEGSCHLGRQIDNGPNAGSPTKGTIKDGIHYYIFSGTRTGQYSAKALEDAQVKLESYVKANGGIKSFRDKIENGDVDLTKILKKEKPKTTQ